MVQASITGAIDLRDGAVDDRDWWLRLRWTLDFLHSQRDKEATLAALHQQQLLAATAADDFPTQRKKAEALYGQLLEHLFPWEEHRPRTLREIAAGMRQQYVDQFGDPNDPEFQKEMAKTIAHLRGLRGETDEQPA